MVAVSFGAITCSPYAVAQPALEAAPWLTPSRNDTVWPGPTINSRSGLWPKKSLVVCVGLVGSEPPERLMNWIPG